MDIYYTYGTYKVENKVIHIMTLHLQLIRNIHKVHLRITKEIR